MSGHGAWHLGGFCRSELPQGVAAQSWQLTWEAELTPTPPEVQHGGAGGAGGAGGDWGRWAERALGSERALGALGAVRVGRRQGVKGCVIGSCATWNQWETVVGCSCRIMINQGLLGGAGFRPSTVGVLFGWFGERIEGDSWFTWWFNHLPGPSIFPKRKPMGCVLAFFSWLEPQMYLNCGG